jgi:hypothetical protein
MMNVILRISMLDGVGRNFLQADCAAKNRATVFIGALRHQRTAGAAMTGIHTRLLKSPECSEV